MIPRTCRLLLCAALVLGGCSSLNEELLRTPPQVGKVRLSSPEADRQAYYQKVRVSGVNEHGSRVGGELFTDQAIRHHYKAYGAVKAISLSRQATSARTKRTVASIVAPVAGAVIGFYAGYYYWLYSSYSAYSSSYNNNLWALPAGAVAGALIGGVAIALPINLTQKTTMLDKRQDAAEEFNRDLKRKLKLDGGAEPEGDKAPDNGSGLGGIEAEAP